MKKSIKHKAIIFDMDGTIVDTNTIWDKANEKLLISKGITYTPEIHQTLKSLLNGGPGGLRYGCALLKQMFNLSESPEELAQQKREIAYAGYAESIDFIDGFIDFYNKIAHIPKSIATNADDHTLALTHKKLQLDHYFGAHIYGISHVNNTAKPDPAIFLYAAQKLGYSPSDCVVIEDSAAGIKAAQAAGMYCIGINTHGNRDLIAQADSIVDHYSQIDFLEIVM